MKLIPSLTPFSDLAGPYDDRWIVTMCSHIHIASLTSIDISVISHTSSTQSQKSHITRRPARRAAAGAAVLPRKLPENFCQNAECNCGRESDSENGKRDIVIANVSARTPGPRGVSRDLALITNE